MLPQLRNVKVPDKAMLTQKSIIDFTQVLQKRGLMAQPYFPAESNRDLRA